MATPPKDAHAPRSSVTSQTQKPADFRRSQRVLLRVPVRVSGVGTAGPFSEDTTTLIVNAHGALVSLAAKVTMGQTLSITNLRTDEKLDCCVAHIALGQSAEIGLGFASSAPLFWRIAFPPEDWVPPVYPSARPTG